MDPFANVEDVEAVWGELSIADEALVEAWLDAASTRLRLAARRRRVDIDAAVASDPLTKLAARDAVVIAVKRVLMNPEGLRQRARTTGPFSRSETVDSALSSGQLYIAPADLDDLFPPVGGRILSFHVRSGYRS